MSDASTPPTRLPDVGDPKALYIVDISAYVFRAYYALPPLSNAQGEATHAVQGVANMLLKLLRQQKPQLLAIAMDSPGPSFRKEMFPEYKANRSKAPDDLKSQMVRVRELCEASDFPVFEEGGFEADDLIATLAKRAHAQGMKVVIVSADKDLLQLVTDDIIMYDTGRDRIFGIPETVEKMGVPPHLVRDLLALMGDSSDNIPGVPSVGPKTAKGLLGTYASLDDIYENLEEIQRKGTREKLREHRDKAYLSLDLVSLKEDVDIEVTPDRLTFRGSDPAKLRPFYQQLGFSRLLQQLDREHPGLASASSASDAPTPAAPPKEAVTFEHEDILTEAQLKTLSDTLRAAPAVAIHSVLTGDNGRKDDLIGLAVALPHGYSAYIPVGHRYIGAPEQLSLEKVADVLGPVLRAETRALWAEDLKRERLFWRRQGVALAGAGFDAQVASYLLFAERRDHSLRALSAEQLGVTLPPVESAVEKKAPLDSAEVSTLSHIVSLYVQSLCGLESELRQEMQQAGLGSLFDDLEIPLTEVLADLEEVGIRLDDALLAKLSGTVSERLVELEKECHRLAGRSFNVASPRQLETILFDDLELPVIKKTKTARSTNQEVLEELRSMHALPGVILEYRGLAKLKNTYLDALPREVDKATGRIHSRFNQTVAQTGRLSSSEPNLQNIPIRTELGRRVRDAFVPRDDWSLMAADYSQIELRVLAHLSGDPALLDAYQNELDVHARTAAALFGIDESEVTKDLRSQGKTVNFAVIYGQTQFALARNLGISRPEAKRYIEAFFSRYAGVRDFMDSLIASAKAEGGVTTILGRRRVLPELKSRNHNIRQAGERMARNTPIQGSAADIMKQAMVRVHRALREQGLRSQMLLTVHDELVFEAPPDEREVLEAMVRAEMAGAAELDVPLVVDIGWGAHWGEAH